jgi:hypothetical protein
VQLDVDIAEWVAKVYSCGLTWPGTPERCLRRRVPNYIFIELECEVLEFEDYSQKLERLIEEARATHFDRRLRYEECKSKTVDVQETMRNAVELLASVKESQ